MLSCASVVALSLSSAAYANPEEGQVTAGSATIQADGKKLDVHQHSDRAVIDWRSFDIDIDEHTQFHQPSSAAAVLNRVNSNDPSRILGRLSANGNVVLVNPNGVFFGAHSRVDVNGLIATSADIANDDFMADRMRFTIPGAPDAAVVNAGRITATEAGLVALVAPNVANHGVISARMGRVELASGDSMAVDLYGDGLYELAVNDTVASQLIANTGSISAEGGTVAITAAAGREIVNSLVVIGGELRAPTVEERGGTIIIAAEGSNAVAGNRAEDKGQKDGQSSVLVAGAYLDAAGRDDGEQGGVIDITADSIALLDGTVIDASGHSAPQGASEAGDEGGTATLTADRQVRTQEDFLAHGDRAGGSIRIGGDYLGGGDTAAAESVYVAADTLILNDALESGDGGRTIVWSDDTTQFYGNVLARGGVEGGDGGFLETSGKRYLDARGYADLTAQDGYAKGTYLLDPADITIYGNVDATFQSTDGSVDLGFGLQLWLDAADPGLVTLTYSTDSLGGATASGTAGTNTITTSADVSANLQVGARIRLGAAGAVTTADNLGSDTYTITAISGTSITVQETLTGTYSGDTLRRGLVSAWTDKSAEGNDATQLAEIDMPLWVSNGLNGNAVINFDGTTDYLSSDTFLSQFDSGMTIHANVSPDVLGNVDSIAFWRGGGSATGLHVKSPNPSSQTWAYHWDGNSDTYTWTGGPDAIAGQFQQVTARYFASETTISLNGGEDHTNAVANPYINDSTTPLFVGWDPNNANRHFDGSMTELLFYDGELSEVAGNLIAQYQSAKWDVALDPVAGAATEAAEAMDATSGYSAFTTDYLERLSDTADIVLQASNSITLDLQGDALTLDDDRSITLQTTSGDIATASAGSIVTNRTGTGGNITFTAGGTGDINIDHALTLNAQNGGEVIFNAGGMVEIAAGGNLTLTQGTLAINTDSFANAGSISGDVVWNSDAFTSGSFTGSGDGITLQQDTAANSLGIGAGGSPDITLSDVLVAQLQAGFSDYTFGRLDGGAVTNYTASWEDPVTFLTAGSFTNAADMTSDDVVLARAGGDVILDQDIATTSAAANALVLDAGGDFVNNAGGDALSAVNSRWLVYSSDPADNQRDGLLPDASDFNKTYTGNAPATIGTGDRFVYATATRPTLTYQVADDAVEYGDALSGTPTLTYSAGLVGDDSLPNLGLTGSAAYSSSYSAGDDAGTYNGTLSATLGTLSSALGYQFAFADGNLTVTKATVAVSLADSAPSRLVGAANPPLDLSYSGFKLGQDESVLDSLPTVSTAATTASPAGTYNVVIAGGSDANYDLSYSTPAATLAVVSSSDPPAADVPSGIPNTVAVTSQDPENGTSRAGGTDGNVFDRAGTSSAARDADRAAGGAFIGVHQSLVEFFALQSKEPLARMFGLQLADTCLTRNDGGLRLAASCG